MDEDEFLNEEYYKEVLRSLGYQTEWKPTFPPKPSPAALRLYKLFEGKGLRPSLEYPEGRCWIDLAFTKAFSPAKIAIEVDGFAAHFRPDQVAYDERKDYFLRSRGWDVIRIRALSIYSSPEKTINNLMEHLENIQNEKVKKLR